MGENRGMGFRGKRGDFAHALLNFSIYFDRMTAGKNGMEYLRCSIIISA